MKPFIAQNVIYWKNCLLNGYLGNPAWFFYAIGLVFPKPPRFICQWTFYTLQSQTALPIINLLPYAKLLLSALDLDSNHFKMTCSVGLQDTLSRHSEQTAIHSLYLCFTILKYINKTEKERRAARAHRIHRLLSFIWLLCKIAVQYFFVNGLL